MQDPSIGVYVLYPTPETWNQGDRAVTCIATSTEKAHRLGQGLSNFVPTFE
jgi:hypothetical protein